jgi:opacity protein-like surface antigen
MIRKTASYFFWLLVACLLPTMAAAQKNELSLVLGGYAPIGTTLGVTPSVALQGSYARRVAAVPLVAAYLELPVTGAFHVSPSNTLASTFAVANYSALFVTPGLKVKLAPSFFLSPYLAVGGGLAHYNSSIPNSPALSAVGLSGSGNKAVFDIGGGVDLKVLPFVSLRGEVRDFKSAAPSLLNLLGITGHNLFGGGGIVLRF